jgi:formylmethanofuran dehydrogenase subunit D
MSQGRHINIGKDTDEYRRMVGTLQMNELDMTRMRLSPGMRVRVLSEWGDALFQCSKGDLPPGIVFALYGPPTSALMGGNTDGTGMPTQKGLDVEVEAADRRIDNPPSA